MNPYSAKPDFQFWSRTMPGRAPEQVDPITAVPFRIAPQDKIATAGSCFAQHISRTLVAQGYNYFVSEPAPAVGGENYGVFPARFGNIYTVRQLLQTFDRAYALFQPSETVWRRADGAMIDPFRPQIQSEGFPSETALETDRKQHLRCIRRMFEDCDVFIFTLGLTEGWRSARDGAVVPLPPGVVKCASQDEYSFHNFTVSEQVADISRFIEKMRAVNPGVRVILTVSPVSLKATYEGRHVLVSNTYSKAALRVVAEEISSSVAKVFYFPSYEIIMSSGNAFFAADRRSVTDAGVQHVMSVFTRHLLGGAVQHSRRQAPSIATPLSKEEMANFESVSAIICDEDALEPADAA
jgi:hypothetical protein